MNASNETNQGNSCQEERRKRTELREIFDDVCRITAPFFDAGNSWGVSSLTMYARQTVREAYPQLTQQDIAILLSSIQRFHATHQKKSCP